METEIGGINGANPLKLSMPVMIAPMSYGALSRSTKQAVAMASAMSGIAENTGEGGMSDAQLTQGAGVYLTELDKLAKVTGMTRKEAEAARVAQQSDARMRNMINKLEGKARENLTNSLAFLDNKVPGLSDAFKDLACYGIIAQIVENGKWGK